MAEIRKKRKWIKWAVVGCIVLVIGSAALYAYFAARQAADLQQSGSSVQAENGDIEVIVQASGSVRSAESTSVYAPLTGTVGSISVKNGDRVKKGDLLFTMTSGTIDDEIASLQTNLTDLDTQIRMADASKSSSVTSPVTGIIKAVYAVPDETCAAAMESSHGLFLISADGYMELRFSPATSVEAGSRVTVTIGEKTVDASVSTYSGGEAVILMQDDSFDAGSEASAAAPDGTALGSGTLTVHMPYYVTGYAGVVSEINAAAGQEVYAGDRLLTLKDAVYSDSYLQLLASRQDTYSQLLEKQAKKEQLSVRAPQDGVVENLSVTEETSVPEGQLLFSVGGTDSFTLTVSVDELDIADIAVGQTAKISFDALSDGTYTGKVTRVSGTGTYTNGVTSYDVTVSIDQPEKILAGMSARADILIASHTNILLVPVTAIKTIDGEKYVMAVPAPGTKGAASSEGVQTKVTVGLINGTQAEILSGITEGQYVQDLSSDTETDGLFGFRNANQG